MSRQAQDDGFTLIEILIAIMISTIILTVLVAAFLTFFQNSTYVSGRDDHAAGAEALSAWLDRDLASASYDPLLASYAPASTSATACAGSPVVLKLYWTDYRPPSQPESFPTSTNATAYEADYVYAPDTIESGKCMIQRTLKSGPVGGTLVAQSSLQLMHYLVGSDVTVSIAPSSNCAAPARGVTVLLAQYHASASQSDAAIPYTYFGCIDARTNGPNT